MKVALELQPCCGKRSGIGNYTYEIATRLENVDGLEFAGNIFNFLGRNDNSTSLNGITMPIRESKYFPYGVYRRIWDVVPVPYQSLFPGKSDLSIFFNYIVPPKISGKVMTTVFDMTYMRFPKTMDRRNFKRLQQGMRYSVERSDRILTISEFSKAEIVKFMGVSPDIIEVVPCAPSVNEGSMAFSAVADKFLIRKPYILYVGTIEPRKNLLRLLEAFRKLRDEGIQHQLVLAGGKGWENDEILREISENENVVLTGYVSNKEKNTLYENADVFVFPSLYEGFGIPPLEAMLFGCPVVTSNAASLPEVVGDAAELVDPMNVLDITNGIWKVLSDRSYAGELIQKGYKQINKYTWTASAKKLTVICKSVLGV